MWFHLPHKINCSFIVLFVHQYLVFYLFFFKTEISFLHVFYLNNLEYTLYEFDCNCDVFPQGAQRLLELKGLREGLFLVRGSKKNPNWHVLTVCHDQKVFNYEIKTKVCAHCKVWLNLYRRVNSKVL